MRVLVCHRPGGAFGYITDGWLNALRDKGHDAIRWDGQQGSWDNFDPDLYIGCSGHRQNIPAIRRAKVAIHVNPWGPVNIEGIMESSESKEWVHKQKPDAVFGYGYESDRIFWSYWYDRSGIQWVPMPTAGDKVIYKYITDNKNRPFDLIYLGGIWPYKALTINEYLIPALRSGLSYKLNGWGEWPKGMCTGVLPDDKVCQFFNIGKIGPCISEKHTKIYGIDIPERAFKIALSGALVIHDAVPRLDAVINGVVMATTPNEYVDKCRYYIEHKDERIALVDRQRACVLNNHTYHNRMNTLLQALGFKQEAISILSE